MISKEEIINQVREMDAGNQKTIQLDENNSIVVTCNSWVDYFVEFCSNGRCYCDTRCTSPYDVATEAMD